MRITTIKQLLLFTLLLSALTTACQAQTDDGHTADERIDGRYLLDLGYTQTDSYEGFGDAFIPGLTWLVSADIRLGLTTFLHKIQSQF